ncbi:ribosome maturation factor RimM [Microlunatus flavus]|uniref:Ribosome maturation factor RimM n=1 Tax=Microlunatus flavus TaxID=1036181 RepID=A0A1H9DQ28_9ACTN|nr:ribosome maturation factor RimM [Microlunatus flavus]SEQ15521.1 16S rRNA processing protein RimM [Microlunatus flavus]
MTPQHTEGPDAHPDLVEVTVGALGRAHGIRGDVAIDLRTDEPERRFADGARLRVEGSTRVLTVESSRWHSGRLLVHFVELADRTAAEGARGLVLVTDVPSDEVPTEEGEYYDRQLLGLAVETTDGRAVGTVRDVLHPGPQDLLEITTDAGIRLVPFVEALVPEVDLAGGRIVVADVPGLLTDLADEPDQADEPA